MYNMIYSTHLFLIYPHACCAPMLSYCQWEVGSKCAWPRERSKHLNVKLHCSECIAVLWENCEDKWKNLQPTSQAIWPALIYLCNVFSFRLISECMAEALRWRKPNRQPWSYSKHGMNVKECQQDKQDLPQKFRAPSQSRHASAREL